ncbi:MAG: zinc ribbon domain-containing protein ['Candidatus Kapabacteria' thiocyanatum]|uniref:FmdB family transcriptional regulator n=1 Tax=Candidatus Kapaibacterium thiocyanatum TaxID=1895771 RepID=A0A1M3KX52_9BACT|nr:zinc ribbon domain-containing protein ['Candidatus Kapabacteria' thiocyanatum]OJX56844.1 MAG: FmdB family transcriptional regulator ['Candidatus Kapabacteria' thiocyanatum]
MPTYDYHCATCGKDFEVIQSMKDEPLTHCPPDECPLADKGKGNVERRFSAGGGVIYKGGGFYLTDYVRKGKDSSSSSGSDS